MHTETKRIYDYRDVRAGDTIVTKDGKRYKVNSFDEDSDFDSNEYNDTRFTVVNEDANIPSEYMFIRNSAFDYAERTIKHVEPGKYKDKDGKEWLVIDENGKNRVMAVTAVYDTLPERLSPFTKVEQ
jgi:flagellar hook-associated protein FlgK